MTQGGKAALLSEFYSPTKQGKKRPIMATMSKIEFKNTFFFTSNFFLIS